MEKSTMALIIEEGTKLIADVARWRLNRPIKRDSSVLSAVTQETEITPKTASSPAAARLPQRTSPETTTPKDILGSAARQDLPYRWECCVKHIGGASVLLREAFERANDEGMGEGTAEKIIEAMNEHAGAESDLEKMLDFPEVRDETERILSGVRQFRAAAWKVGLPRGTGTKADLDAARQWNTILLQETLAAVKHHPGSECIKEGM